MSRNLDGRVIGVRSVVGHGKSLKAPSTTDVPETKGDPRYYSNIAVAGKAEKPYCLWIDANKDQPVTAFQLHFADFVSKDEQFPHDRE